MKNIILTSLCFLFLIPTFGQTDVSAEAPRLVFGELKKEGPYKRSEVILQDRLTVSSGDGNQYEVVNFNMIIAPLDGDAQLFGGSGNKLTANMISELYKVIGKDKVIIERVKAMVNGDENNIVDLKPIVLEISGNRGNFKKSDATSSDKEKNATSTSGKYLQATFGDIDVSTPDVAYTLEEILSQTSIGVTTIDQEVKYEVSGFKMIIAYKNDPAKMLSSSSNEITTSMKEVLASVNSGDRILVEGIRATATYKGEMFKANLSPIILTIP